MLLPRAALLLSARPVCAKQLVYSEYGDPAKVLRVQTISLPDNPPAGRVHVKWLAAPVHPADLNTLQGVYPTKPPLPAVAGIEGFGRVEKDTVDTSSEARPRYATLVALLLKSNARCMTTVTCFLNSHSSSDVGEASSESGYSLHDIGDTSSVRERSEMRTVATASSRKSPRFSLCSNMQRRMASIARARYDEAYPAKI
ncbi:unnamed protein product [Heligmosomoides polygyrus]|uniref:Enoyl-[acyl-carrier-protein] reductase, mitochondrial n=1 Tax=Heligmosomoides polygyrus TaxID=6339 RepID=A0A183GEY9_HELPZ|nr:unnamed protein product [Heligmosomoides polygyrus]